MSADSKKIIRITGRVVDRQTRRTRRTLSGLRVEAWDKELVVTSPIANALTDQRGTFILEFPRRDLNNLFADRQALLFFKVFANDELVASTEDSIFWDRDAPDSQIVIEVHRDSVQPPVEGRTAQPFTIQGQIHFADGNLFKEGVVRAFITILGQENLLGDAPLDANGQYELTYMLNASQTSQLANARVVVRVFDTQGKQVGESPAFIPDSVVTVDVVVPNPPPPPEDPFYVRGQVTLDSDKPYRNGLVRIYGIAANHQRLLGETRTDDDGKYFIWYLPGEFKVNLDPNARVVVRVFDDQERLLRSSPLFYASPEEVADFFKIAAPPDGTEIVFSIAGRVTSRQRSPRRISGLRVQAWHKDQDGFLEKLVGSAETDAQGHFLITATKDYFSRFSIPATPDLFFKVYLRDRLIKSTEETLLRAVASGREDIVIELDFPTGPELDESALADALRVRLIGRPASGARPNPDQAAAINKVIWVEDGDEVLVHLDSMRTRILDRLLLVSLDLETDQTGRAPLGLAFALGSSDDQAGLVAVTDDLPHGNPLLAARWGRALQAAVWASLLGLAGDHAGEQNLAPLGISAVQGTLRLHAGAPLQAAPQRRVEP
jgi:hypothetical protein